MRNNTSTVESGISIEAIHKQNDHILDQIAALENSIFEKHSSMKSLALEWAANLEKLKEAGEYDEPINTICAHIINRLKIRGLAYATTWVYKVLPEKYKQSKYSHPIADKPEDLLLANASKISVDISSTSIIPPAIAIPPTKTSLDEMSREEVQEYAEELVPAAVRAQEMSRELARRREALIETAARRKIALPEQLLRHNDLNPDEQQISTEKEKRRPTVFSAALHLYSKVIEKAANKAEQFPPPDNEAKRFARGIMFMIELWKPWCDEKYRKDTISWWIIEHDNVLHGKHAAATMNFSLTPDKLRRVLTREQVGDKFEAAFKQAVRAWTAYQDTLSMFCWFLRHADPRIAQRASRLHMKLSEKA